MSDKKDVAEKTPDPDVSQQPTPEAVQEVVTEMQAASLAQILELPMMRRAKAVPFTLPGTDLVLKVAPCTGTDQYKFLMGRLKGLSIDGDDLEKREAFVRESMNSIIKACVVEPQLDDAAIDALNEFDAPALRELLTMCIALSGLGEANANTEVAESFF